MGRSAGPVLMGTMAGAISLLVLRRQVFANGVVPGVSLILAPVCTGALMDLLGDGGSVGATFEWRSSRSGAPFVSPSEWRSSDLCFSNERGLRSESTCDAAPNQRLQPTALGAIMKCRG
jgi:hypothetical protein